MAERRMFTNKITEADEFTALPPTTQCLYFHLCMSADDDGFSNKIRNSMFAAHADSNDLDLLIQKRFVIPFESGVVVIKHWRMHNLIRGDRYHETDYLEEKARLLLKDNGAYTDRLPSDNQVTTKRQPSDNQTTTEVRLGKDSIGKDRLVEDKAPGHNFDKHTNCLNYQYIKESTDIESVEYLKTHDDLNECVVAWLKYKDERKPKSTNHYGETGLIQLLNKIYKQAADYGDATIIGVIEDSMSSNYQGIVWDRIKGKPKQEQNVYDAWANA